MYKDLFRLSNLLTFINIVCGFMSIYNVIEGDYYLAGLLIILGMFFDFVDGFTARLLNGESKFGKQLDSFADVITFGLAPIILVLSTYYVHKGLIYDLALLIYFCAIIFRLARYNLNEVGSVFKGLPSTFSGGFIAFIFLWFPSVFSKPQSVLIFIVLAFLSVIEISYKKIVIENEYHILIVIVLVACYILLGKYLILGVFLFYLFSGIFEMFYRELMKRLKLRCSTTQKTAKRI